jgi:hypothetical protein
MTWRHSPSRAGATAYGSHFLGTWAQCERKGYLQYRAPHPRGGEGLQPTHRSANLLFGAAIHEGMAAYYQSGWKDGQYDYTAGLDAFVASMTRECELWRTPEQYADFHALGLHMLRAYHEWYGPGGISPEYPEIRVATDSEGLPIIEREYVYEVSPSQVFTSRVDLAVMRGDWLCLMEHKTTKRTSLSSLLQSCRFDSQFTGEYLVLSQLMGSAPIQGIIINALVKDATPRGKVPPFVRDYVYRPNTMVEQFQHDLANQLSYIDQLNDTYDSRVAEGVDPWEAARRTYPARGMHNGLCVRFNEPCPYLELCLAMPHEGAVAQSYDPSIYPEAPTDD